MNSGRSYNIYEIFRIVQSKRERKNQLQINEWGTNETSGHAFIKSLKYRDRIDERSSDTTHIYQVFFSLFEFEQYG